MILHNPSALCPHREFFKDVGELETYVMTPNKDILILGFRLAQIYVSANASEEAMNGIVKKGVIAYFH